MKKVSKIGTVAVGVLLLAMVAIPVLAASQVTVGRFVQELAKTKNLNATDSKIALDSLRGVGVRLPGDLDLSKQLTQRDVAELSRRVGLRVTTSEPDALFTEDQLTRFFGSFGDELSSTEGEGGENPGQGSGPGTGNGEPPFDPFSKARGKGKGKAKFSRTPTEPE